MGSTSTPAPEQNGFVPLFNGKDLSGWKVFPAGTGSWTIEDGAIVGSGPTSHLFSERGDYENFVFRVEAKINDGGNSGQYFRTHFGPGFPRATRPKSMSPTAIPSRPGAYTRRLAIYRPKSAPYSSSGKRRTGRASGLPRK
jgi:hypothetical protein